ncbi:helix-turn-helix transcriptional regulator [Streptomyces sp. NPDC048361]|uniref:helix-turn-helix domain-containing protein n=1 Tax=Streptomyces sp. NPDC048361 TaxID=3154720 RepID=UPI00343374E8
MIETFGQALRRLRGSRSLRDVAALAACGKSYIADLEKDRRFPSREIAAALDRALGARGELIALADARPGANPLDQAHVLQRGLHESLTAGPLSDHSLDDVEYTVARHGRATRYRAAAELLPELLAGFTDLRLMLCGRQSAPVRKRLTISVARMSGLMALTLLKLGDGRSAAWWGTGRAAAAAAEDRATLSWMYAQEAYQLYYGGDLEGALELAGRAQQLAGGLPCVGPALAAPLAARAHALLGRRAETSAALAEAEAALQRLDPADAVASAFGYSESQFRFHGGNALTHLRETGPAGEQQERALELYPVSDHMDRALVRLDQAMCLAIAGNAAEAAAHATDTLAGLRPGHLSALITYRAAELVARVPEARTVPEMRVLREMLALPPGERAGNGADQSRDGTRP